MVDKSKLTASTKSRDQQREKYQAYILDVVGAVTHNLFEAAKGPLTQEAAIEAIQIATLKLLANGSSCTSQERRKNAIANITGRLNQHGCGECNIQRGPVRRNLC